MLASSPDAATVTWTGIGIASNPANWSGGAIPQNGDDVVFNNTSTQNCTWNINPSLKFFSFNSGYTGTVSLSSNLTVTGNVKIVYGALNAGSATITVGGDWYYFSGASTPLGDINKDGVIDISDVILVLRIALKIDLIQPCSDINKDGFVDISDVILTLRMSLGLDSTKACTGGLFNPGTSTVVFDGTNQTIYGSTTFYNLTKTVTSADTLYFEAGSTQTIANSLKLQGASSNLLALRSTMDGSYWYIDPQGTRNTSFVDIKDLYNLSSTNIDAPDSVNSGNNSNVNFGGRPINITTNPATNVTAVSATLNATVNPNGLSTIVYFEWDTDTSYDKITTYQSIGSGTSDVSAAANITGLSPSTTYYYRVVANNAGGTDNGSDFNFTTTSVAPNISASPASNDFGSINVGSLSAPLIFTISNTGEGNLVIGSIYLTGTNLDQFVTQNNTCSGMTIAPSATCTIEVLFIPSFVGPLTANLIVPSNDPDTPTLNIGLSGTGGIQQCL